MPPSILHSLPMMLRAQRSRTWVDMPHPDTAPPVNDGSSSLDLIFTEVKERLTRQSAQVSALDSKTNFGLGSASLLTALLGLQQGLQKPGHVPAPLMIPLIALVFLSYLGVVFASYQAYRLRGYAVVPQPVVLRDEYLDEGIDETKRMLIEACILAYRENTILLDEKIAWTDRALGGLAVEAVLLAIVRLVKLLG